MKSCSRCGQDIPSSGSKFCPNCGNELEVQTGSGGLPDDTDDLEFQVTEAAGDNPQLVGQDPEPRNDAKDDLGVVPPHQQSSDNPQPHLSETEGFKPLDDPEDQDDFTGSVADPAGSMQDEQPELLSEGSPFDSDELSEASRQQLERLSEEEIQQINQQMYAKAQVPDPSKNALSDKQKQELVDKLKGLDRPFGNEPIKPGQTRPPEPASPTDHKKPTEPPPAAAKPDNAAETGSGIRMATHGQGVAYFWKNYIQIMSNQSLKAEDTVAVGNRVYSLKPKQFNKPLMIGGGSAVVAILLIFVAVAVFSGGGSGTGKIFGITLDAYDQPYVRSAIIRFPELGSEVRSDAQGFFAVDGLETGTYKIQYVIGSQVLKTDYATVVDDKVTTVTLRPEYDTGDSQVQEFSEATDEAEPQPAGKQESSASQSAKKSKNKRRPASRPGSVVLNANVQDARLVIDGDVLGAGNLTYTGIKAGKHRWEVTADGYKPASGTFQLASGGERILQVELEPEVKQRTPAERAHDFLSNGREALQNGDYVSATQQLQKAIKLDPSLAPAYFELGEASRYADDHQAAYDHYLRAAEIYRFGQKRNAALTAYNRAIEVNGRRTDAYIGRAALYLDNGSVQIAIADLETAEDLNDDDPQVHYGLGEAFFALGKYKKAAKYFDKSRKLSPEDPLPYQALMLCYTQREDDDKVRDIYEDFMQVASEQDIKRFRADNAYSQVWEVVDSE
ncbi:tetratricopeptide repeat protein [candidate division GN15 bacterium]|nr:tetratricopeptide repeat protein [candidate division GN15 bacterium]